jgi:hypothetical protein
MSRPDARDQADRLVTHSQQGAWPGSCARGLVLAPLLIGCEMGIVRNEPQSGVRAPMAEVAPPHVGALRECAETGTACEAPDVETGPCDALFAMGVRVDITHGGQQSGGCGWADARPRPQPLEVPTRLP